MSLTKLIKKRRGRELLDYIDGLPSASRLREAILNDPEEAVLLAQMPEPEGEWSPRVSEWKLEHALTYELRGLLVSILRQMQMQASGKTPKPIKPLPSPRTLLDDVRETVRREHVENMKYAFGYRPS